MQMNEANLNMLKLTVSIVKPGKDNMGVNI